MPHTQKRKRPVPGPGPKPRKKKKKLGRPKRAGRKRIYRRYYGHQRRVVKHRHSLRTSPYAPGQERLDSFRGIDSASQARLRRLTGEEREQLVTRLETELDATLDLIRPVPREEWTPARLAIASGLSLPQVTRVFHDDPDQQRWRHFAHDLKWQAAGCNMTADQMARVMALTPGHRYQQSSQGALRLARAMDSISVGELLEILLVDVGR